MKRLLLTIGLFICLASPVWASNTIVAAPDGVTFTAMDSAWTWTDNYTLGMHTGGIKVNYIMFSPGATGDECIIRDTNATGIILWQIKCSDAYDQRIIYFHGDNVRPYLMDTDPDSSAVLTIKFKD